MNNHPVWRFERQMPEGREFEIYHSLNTTPQPKIYHSHHYYELYFILRGSIRVIAEESDVVPVIGDALIYPPHCMHRVTHTDPAQPYERFYLYLSKEFLETISTDGFSFIEALDRLADGGRCCIRLGEQAVTSLVPMADEIIEAARDTSPLAILGNRCRMILFLIHLLGLMEKSVASTAADSSSRMSDLLRYINQNAAKPLPLDHLAEVFGSSKYTLLHDFKAHTGMTIHQYLLTRRVMFAQQLIVDGVKPRQAAVQSGFTDYTSFYRAFKSRTGKSPVQYGKATAE
ncbi:MAG: helix-turn-helix domain-containing protein [Clostridia bacterium]|nr:helix-turn-helix domain-containing protein [Clostridia bacterium]